MSKSQNALFSRSSEFIAGAADAASLPPARCPEIALIGRANVGKSSLINALTGRRNLARTSSTPGRTRQINLFSIGGVFVLADLPGYGYSKAARSEVAQWMQSVQAYLTERPALCRVLLLIDARRGVMESDEGAMRALDTMGVTYQVVLTKADALKAAEMKEVIENTNKSIALHGAAHPEIIATSCRTGDGIAQLRAAVAALMAQRRQ